MSRVAVITGAASGIGKATAELARERGWTVIGVDRAGADVDVDLSAQAERSALIDRVGAIAGKRVDAVIACAGVPGADSVGSVAVNFFGTRDTLLALRPLLIGSESPRAVYVGSIAALSIPHPDVLAACLSGDEEAALTLAATHKRSGYVASKSAMRHWMRSVAATDDWAGKSILLNAIAPGTVITPMLAPFIATQAQEDALFDTYPNALHRHGTSAEIAEAVLWLASAANGFMVGQHIYVDGGYDLIKDADRAR